METQGKLLLRGEEVAAALNISRALAYRWMAAGILPVVRVPGGRSIRVPQQALLRWIETNTAGAGDRDSSLKPDPAKQPSQSARPAREDAGDRRALQRQPPRSDRSRRDTAQERGRR
jgi:excisionase family DNA binding protein